MKIRANKNPPRGTSKNQKIFYEIQEERKKVNEFRALLF